MRRRPSTVVMVVQVTTCLVVAAASLTCAWVAYENLQDLEREQEHGPPVMVGMLIGGIRAQTIDAEVRLRMIESGIVLRP